MGAIVHRVGHSVGACRRAQGECRGLDRNCAALAIRRVSFVAAAIFLLAGVWLVAPVALAQPTAPTAAGVPTPLTVRVIARGGKFLGDDVGGALVTIRDVDTGEVLASGITHGGSGPATIMTAARDRSQPIPIEDGANSAARFDVVLMLTRPHRVEITAIGPLALGDRGHASAQTWLAPGFSFSQSGSDRLDGFLLEIPGLSVTVEKPAFHFLPEKIDPSAPYEIRANVTMMCGCPIGTELWPASDFSVVAHIEHDGRTSEVPLVLDDSDPPFAPSQFVARDWRPDTLGVFDITVVAYQESSGNLGVGHSSLILTDR
jgi:hypothetical protein